jgi:hypothetical protein
MRATCIYIYTSGTYAQAYTTRTQVEVQERGMVWSGVDWSGAEWNGEVEWGEMEWSGVEWSGLEWSGVEWGGMEWNGVEWCGVDQQVQQTWDQRGHRHQPHPGQSKPLAKHTGIDHIRLFRSP